MSSMAVVVPGPDSYKDVLLVYEQAMKKYWKAGNAVYWFNEEEHLDDGFIQVVNNGQGTSWCKRLKNATELLDVDYILLWLEDIIPTVEIEADDVNEIIQYMDDYGVQYCQLRHTNTTKMKRDTKHPHIWHISPNKPYCISLTVSIFKREYLNSLIINDDWMGWDLENYGLQLASQKKLNNCIYDDRDVGETVHLITKAKMYPDVAKQLAISGFDLSGIHRDFVPQNWDHRNHIKAIIGRHFPVRLRKFGKRCAKALGFDVVTDY